MFDSLFTAFDKSSEHLATYNGSVLHLSIQQTSTCSSKDHIVSGFNKLDTLSNWLEKICSVLRNSIQSNLLNSHVPSSTGTQSGQSTILLMSTHPFTFYFTSLWEGSFHHSFTILFTIDHLTYFILWSDHSNIHSIYKLLYKEHYCPLLIYRCSHTTGLFTFSDSFFNDSWLKQSIGTIYIAHIFSQFTRRIPWESHFAFFSTRY